MDFIKVAVFVGVLGSSQAFAGPTDSLKPIPILQYISTNGSIEPSHRVIKTCNVYANKVTHSTKGAGYRPLVKETQVMWNKSTVKDLKTLRSFVEKTSKVAPLKARTMPPAGSAIEKYLGYTTNGNTVMILSQVPNKPGLWYEKNNVPEAKILKIFIDANCN